MPRVRKLSQEDIQRLQAQHKLEDEPHTEESPPRLPPTNPALEQAYPHVAAWVDGGGWIELGQTEYSRSFVRILDIGGMLWEGTSRYHSLDALFNDAERALIRLEEEGNI